MSVGAVNQAVSFDDNNLTLVLGQNLDVNSDGSRNGAGKTTLFNAISYAFYGEALTRIKVNNLINKTNNKNMFVSLNFSIDETDYRIERGRKPNVLRFFVNNEDVLNEEQQGDSRETQKEIEKTIGFSFTMFKHLIILTMTTEPFLNMKAADQRSLIEEVLGITELTRKAELLQEKIRETKGIIKGEEVRISTIENTNNRLKKTINELKTTSASWSTNHKNSIEKLQQSIEILQKIEIDQEIENHKNKATIQELQKEHSSIQNEKNQNDVVLQRSKNSLTNLQNNLNTAKNGICPSCEQSISHLDTHIEHLKELEENIKNEHDYYQSVKEKNDKLNSLLEKIQIPKIPDTFYPALDNALEHKHNLTSLNTQYEEKIKEENPYINQITKLEKDGLEKIDHKKMDNLLILKEHQEFLYKILTNKDSFIRKKIIDQNRAFLNNRFSEYLNDLGLPHKVKFGNDLDVTIKEYGREMDFDNLSRGEKNRLILALSWAFRDVYEAGAKSVNLICIDELIDSGMDTDGIENSLSILKKMNRERGRNVMLISHKEELMSRVNSVLLVTKQNGFTSYNIE